MIEVGVQHYRVIKIETLVGKVEGDSCSSPTQYCLHFGRQSHVATKFVVERIEESFHTKIKLPLSTERQSLIKWIVMNEVSLDRIGQWEYQPVEFLEVFHIGNQYQEPQHENEPVNEIYMYRSDVREQALDRTRFFQHSFDLTDLNPVLLHAVAMTKRNGVILQRLVIDGHAEWCSDSIHTAIALSNGVLIFVITTEIQFQIIQDSQRLFRQSVLLH